MAGRGLLERLLARRRADATDGVSDAELLARFTRDRDEAAFELLVWRHGGMVLGLCRRAVRDEQLAEDAFQAVFLVLARKASGVRGNLGGWLFKVARRVSARAVARRTVSLPAVDVPVEATPDPAERDELARLLDAEVARLPERLRRPVVLCYLGGRSTADAARELGCPRGTVLSRLAAARTRLAERLTRRGVTLPAALAGVGLSGRAVSFVVALARQFRAGSFAVSPAIQLAEGVIQVMSRNTLLATLGGTLVAAVLVSGVGWVAAQPGPKVEPAAREAPARAPAEPPAKPDPADARKAAEEKIRQLEKVRETLQREIESQEKAIALAARASDKESLATLQKRHADADADYHRVGRELAKLDAEAKVLKKRLDDKKPVVAPDPVLLEQAVVRHDDVRRTKQNVESVKETYGRELQKSPNGALTPYLKGLKKRLDETELTVPVAEEKARKEAIEVLRAKDAAALRERLAKVATDIEIQTEVRERLKVERDQLKKAIDATGAAGVDIETMRKSLAPQQEMLGKIQRQILRLQAERGGITFPPADAMEAKLDLLIREVGELRKEVRELKNKK